MRRNIIGCFFLFFCVSQAYGDMIPCVKWNTVNLSNLNEIIPDISKSDKALVYDVRGKTSELISQACWSEYNMRADYSPFGWARVFGKPREIIPMLCKSRFINYSKRHDAWEVSEAYENYSVALKKEDSCDSLSVDDLVLMSDYIEDATAKKVLLEAGGVYDQYLKADKQAVKGLKISAIGLDTDRELNTYYALSFSDGGCSKYILYARPNEKGILTYVSNVVVMC